MSFPGITIFSKMFWARRGAVGAKIIANATAASHRVRAYTNGPPLIQVDGDDVNDCCEYHEIEQR